MLFFLLTQKYSNKYEYKAAEVIVSAYRYYVSCEESHVGGFNDIELISSTRGPGFDPHAWSTKDIKDVLHWLV